MNSSLAQLHAYSPAPPGTIRPRHDRSGRLGEQRQGLKGTRIARQKNAWKLEIGDGYGDPAPRREIDLRRRDRFGRATHLRESAAPIQDTAAMPLDSNELDSPRPHGIFEAFVKTCQRWRLDHYQRAVLLGLPPGSSLGTLVLSGQVLSPSVDVRDRATRVFEISLGLGTLFEEDPDVENEWLRIPRARFANTSPLEHMLEGHMDRLIAVADLVRHERGL